ncbi:MAG TPA: hypothetical protein VGH34_17045 [Vicinamibacterales bacterium]|jgi:nucleotide-binding universal stress UspA family protein
MTSTPFTPILPEQYVDSRTYQLIDAEAQRESRQQLRRLLERAKKAGVNGRTGLKRFFAGSVASRLVATVRSPVMTVRG